MCFFSSSLSAVSDCVCIFFFLLPCFHHSSTYWLSRISIFAVAPAIKNAVAEWALCADIGCYGFGIERERERKRSTHQILSSAEQRNRCGAHISMGDMKTQYATNYHIDSISTNAIHIHAWSRRNKHTTTLIIFIYFGISENWIDAQTCCRFTIRFYFVLGAHALPLRGMSQSNNVVAVSEKREVRTPQHDTEETRKSKKKKIYCMYMRIIQQATTIARRQWSFAHTRPTHTNNKKNGNNLFAAWPRLLPIYIYFFLLFLFVFLIVFLTSSGILIVLCAQFFYSVYMPLVFVALSVFIILRAPKFVVFQFTHA